MLAIQSNGDRIFGKRNSLSSHKYLKSFVTNHGTWPHYFILMSCHTWQKYDMNNKNKEDLCWEADQLPPLVPSKKTYFMGYTVRSTMGKKKKKNQVQRSCRLANWNKVVRHSQNIQFYTCFISEFSWWNGTATHFVLPAVERQRWKKKQKARNRKKKGTFNTDRCIFNLCHGHKSKSPKFYETCCPTSLHLCFFILFVVMQLW